jgi:hypothetical protein
MKQGLFTSDLTINGDTLNPKIQGNLDFTGIDVPVVAASVKDVSLKFKPDNINIKAKGAVLDNAISLNADVINKLTPPYTCDNFYLKFKNLDMNAIKDAMQNYETTMYKQNLSVEENTKSFDPSLVTIKNGKIKADKIKLKELTAKEFVSHFSLNKDMRVKIRDYSLKLADGVVSGDAVYNLKNNHLDLNTKINNFNAQIFSESLFDMKSQVYGILNGNMKFSCTGKNDTECIKTLAGQGEFNIKDGRMPKLGSLEYLLKATNIVTSGITRISINNIIDLITPLKTGEFKSINGSYIINNGIVKDIEIFSHGNDLNLYLTGSYDIESYVAKMEVYGTLSSNITSVFGKLKNLSLNTFLNTIPILNNTEYSPAVQEKIKKIPANDTYSVSRIFAAIIDGDINGLNYVKSFKWVK